MEHYSTIQNHSRVSNMFFLLFSERAKFIQVLAWFQLFLPNYHGSVEP